MFPINQMSPKEKARTIRLTAKLIYCLLLAHPCYIPLQPDAENVRGLMRNALLILLILTVVGCAPAANTSRQSETNSLSCQTDLSSSRNDFTGIGINHTNNVRVSLVDGRGDTTQPTETETGTTDNGINFTSLTYFRVQPDSYSAVVTSNGREIDTIRLELAANELAILTVFCS